MDGKYVGEIKGKELKEPYGVVIYESEIFISDYGNNCISVWDLKSQQYLRSIGKEGNGEGEFSALWSMCLSSQNQLVVCDRGNHRLQMFK